MIHPGKQVQSRSVNYMSSCDNWTQGKDVSFLPHYVTKIVISKDGIGLPMAALRIGGTEQFFHKSMEAAMSRMSCALTLISRQVGSGSESWADLMMSRRKKEIAALDIGLEGHLTARNRFLGLVSKAVLCR